MKLLLAGDIGGTSTRLRLAPIEDWRSHQWERTYASPDFSDLAPVVQKFLAELAVPGEVVAACFAVAGPVINGVAKLQNLAWQLEVDRLTRSLNIPNIRLINDFAAVGYGLAHLRSDELHVLQVGEYVAHAPQAVIGAGTGLGQGYLIPAAGKYQVLASEGGHSDFAARTPLEFELVEYLMERDDLDHVSYDRLVSGRGIVNMYRFLRDREAFQQENRGASQQENRTSSTESPLTDSTAIATAVQQWEQATVADRANLTDPAALIATAAQTGTSALARAAMQMFVSAYGAEAGNLALKFLPRGGLYIAGGVAAKNLPLLTDGTFMAAFSQKGRMRSLVAQIPVAVVLNSQVGLIGAAAQSIEMLG
jgi:glucokinase